MADQSKSLSRDPVLRQRVLAVVCLACAGCTMVTDARDYKVDPEVVTRDLDFSFVGMTHPSQPLDVAVVDQADKMQARARIILAPNEPNGQIPTERLVLENGLAPGEQRLFFFADQNEDYRIDPKEHIWIIDPLPESGEGTFVHSTMFQPFTEASFTVGDADLVFDLPLALGTLEQAQACIAQQVANAETLEMRVFLLQDPAADRQVGLFKTYGANRVPRDIRLNGILDAGSTYQIQVLVDGNVEKSTTVTASDDISVTEHHVKAEDWFPFDVTDCFRR